MALRTREVGVRMTFGASASEIKRMVLTDGITPVAQGLALGWLLGSLTRLAIRVSFEAPIAIFDPWPLLIVPIPLGLAAYLACRLPASRAARVDPINALRHL